MVAPDERDYQPRHGVEAGSQALAKSNQPRAFSRSPLTPGGALMR